MNVNFEMAMQLINLESYDRACEELRLAIKGETAKKNDKTAAEYRCVLAELLANLGRPAQSRKEFEAVLKYCEKTDSLPEQKKIAQKFLRQFEEKAAAKKAPAPKKTAAKKTTKK